MSQRIEQFPKPPQSLWKMIGPSFVFVALSLNGGEMLLWPDLVGRLGLQLLWVLPIILFFQYVVNMEIERYTIFTGKNVLQGLFERQSVLIPICIAGILISLVWPAWVSIAGNMTAFLVGLEPKNFGGIMAFCMMSFLLLLWFYPRVYALIEKISTIGVILVLLSVSTIFLMFFDANLIAQNIQPIFVPNDQSDKILFLSSLAFGGVAGVLNLVQSDWVAKRKYGAAALQKDSQVQWSDSKNRKNWHGWWKMVSREHGILFIGGNILGIGLIAFVSVLTVGQKGLSGFSLLTYQVEFLNDRFAYLGTLWGIAIVLLFLMAQMTILDAAGRLFDHCLDATKFRNVIDISGERTTQILGVFGLFILLGTIVIPSFNQPAGLLQLSAIFSAGIFAIYPPLLLQLNSTLPNFARPTRKRKAAVWCASLCYFIVCLWTFL